MRIKILRKYWEIVFKPMGRHKHEGSKVDGLCDPSIAKNKTILIDSRLSGQAQLETIIHEFLHACDQSSIGFVHSEEYVENVAHDMAKLLYKLKYRKVDSDV